MASNEPQPDSIANSKPEIPSDDARADVTAAVEELLNSLSNKFAGVSSEIFAKMDEMSRRLDNLEAALQESKTKDGGSTKSS
ncbi:heat shock factor binding 1 [Fusarium agapanthi]|uniref:Heat shock factor binding 1 n=1 Tax=Fusarium agapanthi TaxID=1803897 RepID=A0A9P5B1A9_9HYPO|nr:heat shock factor binding 1 [Fusarium agapanthi]